MEKTTFTFKLCFGDEIRRLTAIQGTTTFTELEAIAQEIFSSTSTSTSTSTNDKDNSEARLLWTDSDGDIITLRSQSDLNECFAHLAATGTSTLKISLTLPTTTTTNNNNNNLLAPFAAPSTHDSMRLLEGEPLKDDYKTRKHLEKMNEKMKYKEQRWQAELEKLKLDTHFDEKEHLRQLEVLQGASIATYTLVSMLLAKRIIWNNQRAGQTGWWSSWQGWCSSIWEGNNELPSEKLTKMASPRTLQQIQTLREHQMPTGWPVIAYLEMVDKMAVAAALDPVIINQLEQVRDLQHVPEPLKVKVLLDFNEEVARKHEKGCRRHWERNGYAGWFQ